MTVNTSARSNQWWTRSSRLTVVAIGIVLVVGSSRPVDEVRMPSVGVVTVSGSSRPLTITLTSAQASGLRKVIASESLVGFSGICMENTEIFSITVAPPSGRGTSWSAVDEECPAPGQLIVTNDQGRVQLAASSCAVLRYVVSQFPRNVVAGTRSDLQFCKVSR